MNKISIYLMIDEFFIEAKVKNILIYPLNNTFSGSITKSEIAIHFSEERIDIDEKSIDIFYTDPFDLNKACWSL